MLSSAVADTQPAAACVSGGSSSVAAPPGSAAAGLPPAPHGRGLQLLPLQQLCPVLQHYVAVRGSPANVKERRGMCQGPPQLLRSFPEACRTKGIWLKRQHVVANSTPEPLCTLYLLIIFPAFFENKELNRFLKK